MAGANRTGFRGIMAVKRMNRGQSQFCRVKKPPQFPFFGSLGLTVARGFSDLSTVPDIFLTRGRVLWARRWLSIFSIICLWAVIVGFAVWARPVPTSSADQTKTIVNVTAFFMTTSLLKDSPLGDISFSLSPLWAFLMAWKPVSG